MSDDQYDKDHPRTGSGNIRIPSAEWLQVLAQARANPSGTKEYTLHDAYDVINRRVAAGEHWSKCANCGTPYVVEEDGNGTVCSQECGDSYIAYLNNPQPIDHDDDYGDSWIWDEPERDGEDYYYG